MSGINSVSSFGYSGTIAHALTESHSTANTLPQSMRMPLMLTRETFIWSSPPHPLQQSSLPFDRGELDVVVLRSATVGAMRALLANHVVHGRVIFPGAGYLEMARTAACSTFGYQAHEPGAGAMAAG